MGNWKKLLDKRKFIIFSCTRSACLTSVEKEVRPAGFQKLFYLVTHTRVLRVLGLYAMSRRS
jgi:hypothetical protein